MFAIHEYGPPSLLNAKSFGSALAITSCMHCFASPPFSKMNGCVFAMWFCRFLFSLNPALQVSHWNYSYFSSRVWKNLYLYIWYLEWEFTRMSEHVNFEGVGSSEQFSTVITSIFLLATVYNGVVIVTSLPWFVHFSTALADIVLWRLWQNDFRTLTIRANRYGILKIQW